MIPIVLGVWQCWKWVAGVDGSKDGQKIPNTYGYGFIMLIHGYSGHSTLYFRHHYYLYSICGSAGPFLTIPESGSLVVYNANGVNTGGSIWTGFSE